MTDRTPEELHFENDWLLVFLDETGHETFAGNQPYFVVGGCALLGQDHRAITQEWREVRRVVNGSPDAPLHAADLKQTEENFGALRVFFRSRGFARVAAAATTNTKFLVDMHTMSPVLGMLKEQIARVVELTPCTTVALIFESSQRGDPPLMQHFGELDLRDNDKPLPTEHCLMPKKSGEPALEVADFIVSAAGSQTKRQLRGTSSFAPDYRDVFHKVPREYAQFCLITEVGAAAESNEAFVRGLRQASRTRPDS